MSQNSGRVRRLPSVEAQTIAYFEEARASERLLMPRWLAFGGFKVYLRYWRNRTLPDGTVPGELLVIASVTIPDRYQQRGWFWRYCQLCAALAADGVLLECVHNLELLAAHPGGSLQPPPSSTARGAGATLDYCRDVCLPAMRTRLICSS